MATSNGLMRWLRSEQGVGWSIISAPALYAVMLLALPLTAVVVISLWTQTGIRDFDTTFTLANYRELFEKPLYMELLRRSLLISGSVTFFTVITAFPIAYYISFKVAPQRKSRWIFMITIPFWTAYLVRVFLWKVILGYNGVINAGLMKVGILSEPMDFILYNANAVVITLSHAYAPFAILPIYVALEKIDRSYLEAARDLGESTLRTFTRVTLPLAMPGVVAAVLIVFIPTIGDYVTPKLVGGPGGTMIANMIQTQFLRLNNAPLGAALAVVTMMAVAAVSLLFVFLNRRYLKGSK